MQASGHTYPDLNEPTGLRMVVVLAALDSRRREDVPNVLEARKGAMDDGEMSARNDGVNIRETMVPVWDCRVWELG